MSPCVNPGSLPSWAMSAGDVWVAAAEETVGWEPNEARYWDDIYPNDRPEWRPLAAKSQSGCALALLRHARHVKVKGCDDFLKRPYEGYTDAVTLVERMYRRYSALTMYNEFPRDKIFLERGWMIRVGWSRPQRPQFRSDDEFKAAMNTWLSEWGGDEHVLLVTDVDPDTRIVKSIDGGQPGIHRVERKLSWDSRGRLWASTPNRSRRVASVGNCELVEIDVTAALSLTVSGPKEGKILWPVSSVVRARSISGPPWRRCTGGYKSLRALSSW